MSSGFTRKVRAQAWTRANKHCEGCGAPLWPGMYHYDHIVATAIRKDNSLGNCAVLCRTCHDLKTAMRDIPAIAKVKRIVDKLTADRRSPKPLPAGRLSGLKKTITGTVVPRLTQAELHRELMARRNFKED